MRACGAVSRATKHLQQRDSMLTGQQIKAARELLGWTPYRLAPRAGMGHTLLRQFESGARPLDPESAARLRAALEEAGVQFPSNGSCTGIRLGSETHAVEFATAQMTSAAGQCRSPHRRAAAYLRTRRRWSKAVGWTP